MMRRAMLPPLVLLHGFTQTRQSWRRTAQALAGRYRAHHPGPPRPRPGGAPDAELRRLRGLRPRARPAGAVHARRLLDGRPDRAPRRAHARPASTASSWSARARASPTRQERAAAPRRRRRAGGPDRDDRRSRRSRASGARSRCSPASRSASRPPPTPTACATRPHGLAAALRGLGTGRDGAAVGSPAGADDPGHADHRRARREVPRARRGRCSSGYRTRSTCRSRTPATRRSSRTPTASRRRIHQSGSPSSSASA